MKSLNSKIDNALLNENVITESSGKAFRLYWLDENNNPNFSIRVFFKNDVSEINGEQQTPYIDPSCTIDLGDLQIDHVDSYGSEVEEI